MIPGLAGMLAENAKQIQNIGVRSLQVDVPLLQAVKTLIRYSEARSAAGVCGVPAENCYFLDMPFYETGDTLSPAPACLFADAMHICSLRLMSAQAEPYAHQILHALRGIISPSLLADDRCLGGAHLISACTQPVWRCL